MITLTATKSNKRLITNKITDFYISIWLERMLGRTLKKYHFNQARTNVRKALTAFGRRFKDTDLRKPKIKKWCIDGMYEIYFNKWHFAVFVQLDMFNNNVALVQDCCHDKDYHDDTMETRPFVMDNPNDLSHLVDWDEHQFKSIVENVIRSYLQQNLLRP